MAPRITRSRPVRPVRAVLVSAEEKAARAQLVQSAQMGVVANQEMAAQRSRGAFETRPLRRGGTELAKYDTNRFSNTYGKPIGTFSSPVPAGKPGGAGKKINRRDPGTRRRTPPQPSPTREKPPTRTRRQRTSPSREGRSDERRGRTRGTENARTRAEARRRAEAARRERERKAREAGRGTEKSRGRNRPS